MTLPIGFVPDPEAQENESFIRASVRRRREWEAAIPIKNSRYYLCDQWSEEELEYLRRHNRFPLTINIFAPIVDSFVSLICGANPKFKAVPLNDESVDVAYLADFVLDYVWYISHGNRELVHTAQDYALAGIGWMMQDWDPLSDNGDGDVVVRYLAWPYVHWDPESTAPGYRDAQWFAIVKTPTVQQIKAQWPAVAEFVDRIKDIAQDRLLYGALDNLKSTTQIPAGVAEDVRKQNVTGRKSFLIGDVAHIPGEIGDAFIRLPVIERYVYDYEPVMMVLDPAVGPELYQMSVEDFETAELSPAVRAGAQMKRIRRIKRITTLGGYKLLDEQTRRLSVMPIVPVVKLSAGSILPVAFGSRLTDVQDEENKRRLAIIENATNSAVNKLLAPKNMIDEAYYDERKHIPGALIEYTPNLNNPAKDAVVPLISQQLPNQFYFLEQGAIPMAEYVSGVPAQLISGQNMPETYKQTLQVENYANRKIRAIDLLEFDAMLQQLGQAVLEAAIEYYTTEKLLTIVDEDGAVQQVIINEQDVGSGKVTNKLWGKMFSVKIVTGSTMPESRIAKQQMYFEWYQAGFIDDIEFIRHTDIRDKRGVIERKSQLAQAMGVIQDLQNQVKQNGGIIQSLQRELVQQQVRLSAKEIQNLMMLEQRNAQMEQRLANALLEMQVKSLVKDLAREEETQRKIGRAKVANYVEMSRERVRGIVDNYRVRTASSEKGERESE